MRTTLRIILSVVFVSAGIYTLMIWEVGSHGRIRFRPWMLEDWIFSAILLICFGVPSYFLLKRARHASARRDPNHAHGDMTENGAFLMGTGACLLGIALVVNGMEQVQFGPDWEVPAAAVGNLFFFSIASVVLYSVGVFSYLRGNRFASQAPTNRAGFWLVLSLGSVLTVISFSSDPGQWPITHTNLSGLARKSSVPVSIACGLTWILLVIRAQRKSVPPKA